MKKIIFFFFLMVVTSCATTKTEYVTIPLTKSPEFYQPPVTNSITTIKELVNEYRETVMKISEWQDWYVVQTNNDIGNTNFKE